MTKKPMFDDASYPIGHRQYEQGLGTPAQRLNFELQALGLLFKSLEMTDGMLSHVLQEETAGYPPIPERGDTLEELRYLAVGIGRFFSHQGSNSSDSRRNNMTVELCGAAINLLGRLEEEMRNRGTR